MRRRPAFARALLLGNANASCEGSIADLAAKPVDGGLGLARTVGGTVHYPFAPTPPVEGAPAGLVSSTMA